MVRKKRQIQEHFCQVLVSENPDRTCQAGLMFKSPWVFTRCEEEEVARPRYYREGRQAKLIVKLKYALHSLSADSNLPGARAVRGLLELCS